MHSQSPLSSIAITRRLLVAGCLFAAGAAAQTDAPRPVTLAEVRLDRVQESVDLSGTATAKRRVMLTPRVEGLVAEVLVDAGSWVEPGDPVLALDDRLAVIDVTVAEASLAEAEAALRDARRIRDELLRLEKGRHASATSIASSKVQVEIKQAAAARRRAELERARELRRRHRVSAPFAGMVVEKRVEVGQWVQRDDAVAELVAVDTLRVRVPLPQRFYARVAAGARVQLAFDALPGRQFPGRVSARVAAGNDSSRSFPLLIDIPNPQRLLAPGMSARIRVALDGGAGAALTVPRDALVTKADGRRQLWRIGERDGVARAYPVVVEVDRAQGDRVEVRADGLAAGDRVVLLGNETLRPGQAVRPAKGGGPAAGAD